MEDFPVTLTHLTAEQREELISAASDLCLNEDGSAMVTCHVCGSDVYDDGDVKRCSDCNRFVCYECFQHLGWNWISTLSQEWQCCHCLNTYPCIPNPDLPEHLQLKSTCRKNSVLPTVQPIVTTGPGQISPFESSRQYYSSSHPRSSHRPQQYQHERFVVARKHQEQHTIVRRRFVPWHREGLNLNLGDIPWTIPEGNYCNTASYDLYSYFSSCSAFRNVRVC